MIRIGSSSYRAFATDEPIPAPKCFSIRVICNAAENPALPSKIPLDPSYPDLTKTMPSLNLNFAILSLCFTFCFVADCTYGQEVGDRVVVTANFETKIYKKVVDQVFEGEIHTITRINGKWCSLDNVEGWLPLQYVMNMESAEKQYDKRIKDNPQDAEALAHRGMIHYENEEFAKAFTDLNSSLRINQKNPVTWSNRGMVLNAQQKYELALRDLAYSIKLNPKFPHAHFNMGRVYYAVNDFEKAIAAYDKAIELNPEVPRYFVNRGSARLYARDYDGAREDYLKSIELNKQNSDAHVGLSNLALAQNDLNAAFAEAERAVEIQPKNAMALNARGWVLYKQGKIDEAIFDLSRAISYAPNCRCLTITAAFATLPTRSMTKHSPIMTSCSSWPPSRRSVSQTAASPGLARVITRKRKRISKSQSKSHRKCQMASTASPGSWQLVPTKNTGTGRPQSKKPSRLAS